MSYRQLLVIDPDPGFIELLERELGPYGVAIDVVNDGSDGLTRVKQANPELIFIAVDLPDKAGYAICNRAKKGVAKNIPVIMATGTVPPADLEQHRKLRVHADDYIDKRTLTPDELINKVHQLIDLSSGEEEDLEIPVEDFEFDEASLSTEEIEVEDMEFPDADVDIPVAGHLEVEAQFDAPEPVHSEIDVGQFLPDPIPEGGFGEHTGEATRLQDFVDDGVDVETDAAFAAMSLDGGDIEGEPPPLEEVTDLHAAPEAPEYDEDSSSTGVDFEIPLETEAPRTEARVAEPIPRAVPVAPVIPEAPLAAPVAQTADLEPTVNASIAAADQINELSTEVERLRAALSAARDQKNDDSKFAREREFLGLRETINKKDKDLVNVKQQLDDKERALLDLKQESHGLEKALSAAEEKSLGVENRLVTASEKTAELERRMKELDAELAEARQKADNAKVAALAESEQAIVEATERLAGEHAEALRQASSEFDIKMGRLRNDHAKQRADIEEEAARKLEKTKEAHAAELDAVRGELEGKHTSELETLRSDHASALAAADTRRQDELAAAEEARTSQLAEAEERRASELESLTREHEEAITTLGRDKDEARESALSTAATEHARALEAADKLMARKLDEAEERRQRDMADADSRRERELGELAATHDKAMDAARTEHEDRQTDLEQSVTSLQGELKDAERTIAVRDKAIDSYQRDVAERDEAIDRLKSVVDSLEQQSTSQQERLLAAHKRIKSDAEAVDRAKKALAIALTVLDEQVHSGDPTASALDTTSAPQPAQNAS